MCPSITTTQRDGFIDASIRIAYSGVWCPAADEIEFVKVPKEGDPEPVPARIRIKTPNKIVTNSTDPLTIMEIDPVDDLEKERTTALRYVHPIRVSPSIENSFSNFERRLAKRRNFQSLKAFPPSSWMEIAAWRRLLFIQQMNPLELALGQTD